jgi:hypothetical protein
MERFTLHGATLKFKAFFKVILLGPYVPILRDLTILSFAVIGKNSPYRLTLEAIANSGVKLTVFGLSIIDLRIPP